MCVCVNMLTHTHSSINSVIAPYGITTYLPRHYYERSLNNFNNKNLARDIHKLLIHDCNTTDDIVVVVGGRCSHGPKPMCER